MISIPRRLLPLLGYAIVLACGLFALWLACVGAVPHAWSTVKESSTKRMPYFAPATDISDFFVPLITPLAIASFALLVLLALRKGPPRLLAFCQTILPLLAWSIGVLALYLLVSASAMFVKGWHEKTAEVRVYRQTFDRFVLLETAQGRIEAARAQMAANSLLKMTPVQLPSELTPADRKERLKVLVSAIKSAPDQATKRRLLATLPLFEDEARRFETVEQIYSLSVEVGMPPQTSREETLNWISDHLHQDGWDPVPLYRIAL